MTRLALAGSRTRNAPPPALDPVSERQLARIFGANLRRVRVAQGLSLERLSRAAGASPAKLAAIESGRSAPSLDTAWKIAVALDVPFAALSAVEAKGPAVSVVRAGEGDVVARGRTGSTRALFALGHPFHAELYELSLAAGRTRRAEQRAPGTVEKVVVHSGVLELLVEGEVFRLGVRDAVTLRADRPYAYRNPGRATAVAFVVLSHPHAA